MSKPIDVHCHIFNKDVLTYRIVFGLIESLVYAAIYKQQEQINKADVQVLSVEMKKIYNFVKTGMAASSLDIYQNMESEYMKVFGEDFIAVPLTFDLYFCFKGSMKIKKQEQISTGEMKELSREMKGEVNRLISQLDTDMRQIDLIKDSPNDKPQEIIDFKQTKEDLKEMVNYFKDRLTFSIKELMDTKLVGSFKRQLIEVQKVREKFPDKVFPFYAADPRRYNIVGHIKKNVQKSGPYYGVKVYAPNGYSPTDPDMQKIYDYCSAQNLPITAHCSHVGFAGFENTIRINGIINDPEKGLIELKKEDYSFSTPFLGKNWVEERASVLNDPIIWELMLEKFPNMKLNLAHFGKWPKGNVWTDKIFEMMHRFPNLYTDLSCFSERDKLVEFKELYWSKATESVKKRFMYGSDFYLNLVFSNSFNEYLNNFKEVFTTEEFNQIAIINPRRFLGIDI